MSGTLQILMVEDERRRFDRLQAWLPPDMRIVWVRSAGAALGVLRRDRRRTYAGVLLDHDLQGQVRTTADQSMDGRDIVDAIAKLLDRDTLVFVHSMNEKHAPEMANKLEAAGFSVDRMPFESLTEERFRQWCDEVREQWDGG